MSDETSWQAEGQLSFSSFICDLLRTDQSVMDDGAFPVHDASRVNFWFGAARGAAAGNDQASHESLPPNLHAATRARLFHERMHFAALLTYPVLQLHAVRGLEELRAKIRTRGGSFWFVAGESSARDPEVAAASANRRFTQTLLTGPVTRYGTTMTTLPDVEGAGVCTAWMQTLDGYEIPGRAGVLRFPETDVIVALNAQHLLESAAHVSQLMFEGRPLPRLERPPDRAETLYLGCWELWARLHRHRHASDEDLALAFLAAVDLALGAHILAMNDVAVADIVSDPWASAEMRYPHARFGALAITAAEIAPAPRAGGTHAETVAAIDDFQRALCLRRGWAEPRRGYAMTSALLTRQLLETSLWTFEKHHPIKDSDLSWAVNAPLHEVATNLDRLRPVWRQISASFGDSRGQGAPNAVFGTRLMAKMVSSANLRVQNGPTIAAPHVAPGALTTHFRLPCVRIGGQYFLDTELTGNFDRSVDGDALYVVGDDGLDVPPSSLLLDCLGLGALESVRRDTDQCGFIDAVTHEPACMYVAAGAGCPQRGLSPEQRVRRDTEGVDNWCHWMHAAVRTSIADPADLAHWADRWNVQRGERHVPPPSELVED